MTERRGRLTRAIAREFDAAVSNQGDPTLPWSSLPTRLGLALAGGQGPGSFPMRPDFDHDCGYPTAAELSDPRFFAATYHDWPLAARVNDIWPDECWAGFPDVYETEGEEDTPFEKAVGELDRRNLVFFNLHRADRLSGVGRFGILLVGLDDGGPLDRPPAGVSVDPRTGEMASDGRPRRCTFLRPFDESLIRIAEAETDPLSPRWGRPTLYAVTMYAPEVAGGTQGPAVPLSQEVHWTRAVHLCENNGASEVYGVPRQRPVVKTLYDIRKVAGSSAEMFYKGGFPGYAFEAYPDAAGDVDADHESLREEVQNYAFGFQRYLASVNGKWVSLQPQVADPSPHIAKYVELICAQGGYPTRVFLGSQSGQLASAQEEATWRTRLSGRRTRYVEPRVVRPVFDRLIDLGCLPRPESYTVWWPDLRSLSDLDRADVALKKVQALMQFQAGNVGQLIGHRLFWTMVMGASEAEADEIAADLKKNPPPPPPAPPTAPGGIGGGGRAGNPAAGDSGQPATGKKSATKPGAAARASRDNRANRGATA